MIRLAFLVSAIALIAILLLGYFNVFIEAANIGYTANLLGQPIAGIAPRLAWEMHGAIVLLGFGTVLLLQQVTVSEDSSRRRASFMIMTVVLSLAYIIATASKDSTWMSDNIVTKSFVMGASSQFVLLGISIALLLITTKVNDKAISKKD